MNKIISIFTICIFIVACSPATPEATPTLASTEIPVETATPEPTATATPTSTPQPTPTPSIIFVSIGSPYPEEWGTPLIWSNDSFNGPFNKDGFDNHHGHVDISVPKGFSVYEGFDINSHQGDVIAPLDGCISKYDGGFHLILSSGTMPDGIQEALVYSGIKAPDLNKVGTLRLDFGHVKNVNTGCVLKGDVVAEIEPYDGGLGQTKLALQFWIYYDNVEYGFSPTLFTLDQNWDCFPGSPYDCVPEPNDYAP